jgi:hypothetical protein
VYTEFQAHYFFLGSLMEALISSEIKGMYEIVWGHYGKFSQTLEEYTRKTSIVAAIPLERKTQAFYPTTLVKVESRIQQRYFLSTRKSPYQYSWVAYQYSLD